MSDVKILQNGVPCFDASGKATMLAASSITEPLGLTQKAVSFTEDPSGGKVLILISDIGEYPTSEKIARQGFVGLCIKDNGGLIGNGFGGALVNAVISHKFVDQGLALSSSHPYIKPCIAKYNDHCYIGIFVQGNSGTLYMIGKAFSLLASPIVLNNRNGNNVADAEILAESPSMQFQNSGGG